MGFYRIAEKSDFDKAENDFSNLPSEAKNFIMLELNTSKAVQFLHENFDYPKLQANVVCNSYLAYLKAKSDFRKGKTVYTEY